MTGLASALVFLATCPTFAPRPGALGQEDVSGPTPPPSALTLNADGKRLYRQGRWPEAIDRYRKALAVDGQFHAAALNLACALARQERYADAARTAADLVRRAHVPWAREVLEATDLAVLHVRPPEIATVRAALAESARAWGNGLDKTLFFVARARPAVRLQGSGVLALALGQEIFAWIPATGRYRQVTAENGRVLAFVRSPDGRRVVYVLAGRLVRPEAGPAALRGLSVRLLEVATMTLGPLVEIPGDVVQLTLSFPSGRHASLRMRRPSGEEVGHSFDGASLSREPVVSPAKTELSAALPPVLLGAGGVEGVARAEGWPGCRFEARDITRKKVPEIRVRTPGRNFVLRATHGAGLFGLPFPSGSADP